MFKKICAMFLLLLCSASVVVAAVPNKKEARKAQRVKKVKKQRLPRVEKEQLPNQEQEQPEECTRDISDSIEPCLQVTKTLVIGALLVLGAMARTGYLFCMNGGCQ